MNKKPSNLLTKKSRTNLTVRLSAKERQLLEDVRTKWGLENDAQTVRALIRYVTAAPHFRGEASATVIEGDS